MTIERFSKREDIYGRIQNCDDIRRMDPGFVAIMFRVIRSAQILVSVIKGEQLEEHKCVGPRDAKAGARGCPVWQCTLHLMDTRFVDRDGAPEAFPSVQVLFDVDSEVVGSFEFVRRHEFDAHDFVRTRDWLLKLEITRFRRDCISESS